MKNDGKDAATVSFDAGLHRSYVGNIIRGKKNNSGRDALIGICLAIETTSEELQYIFEVRRSCAVIRP